MKSSCREHFKNNFVKPLYRSKVKKVKPREKDVKTRFIKLDGSDICINKKSMKDENIYTDVILLTNKSKETILRPSRFLVNNYIETNTKYDIKSVLNNQRQFCGDTCDLQQIMIKQDPETFDLSKKPDVWLRIYPLPKQQQESLHSLIFRYMFCILGLYTVLIIWTIIWVLVIHVFEGPHEWRISINFEEDQNQLIINLATELRLITPISPKWKDAIIKRIEDERRLTIEALARGAKLHPGEFWDLSGTFLFTVYVMTALGFGAPMPQTLWGRIAALIYALLAVPIHLCLILNISSCVNAHIEVITNKLKKKQNERNSFVSRKGPLELNSQSPYSKDSKDLQNKYRSCHKGINARMLSIFCAGQCMPVMAVCYYVSGALGFGWARNKQTLEVVMFPLEFTTSGGLELVEGYVRILYGLYVEGAILLLASSLLVIKKCIKSAVNNMANKNKLFTSIHDK